MKIGYLADHAAFIPTLAPWIADYWGPLLGGETVATRSAKLEQHRRRDSLPLALVAYQAGRVFGTAALRAHDLPGREDLSPWLGGVFVGPAYRGRGIATALCAAIETVAARDFTVSELYLFTLDRQRWYEKRGWNRLEPCTWCHRPGDIMVKRLACR